MKMTSALHRERMRAQELEEMKNKIRENIPVLTKREVRRHRIPFYEALCAELEEDGFEFSASFIRMLVQYQSEMKKKAGPESYIWFHPQLYKERGILEKLYIGLKNAEQGKLDGKLDIECDHLLQLAVHFSQKNNCWWWLAEHIFNVCVNSISVYRKDGGQKEAIARYCFGRFLLTQLNDAKSARVHLTICREHSAGKNWNAKKILPSSQDNLFEECCSLLYKALLIQAREFIYEDPLQAARICSISIKRATDAKDDKGIADCYMESGICEMRAGDACNALKQFNKCLKIYKKIEHDEGYCESCIHVALALARLDQIKEAKSHLETLLKYSEEKNLKHYYGLAHRFLGELYLNQENPVESTPYLKNAIPIFHELNDYENRERVKILAAISAGQELFPKYVELILSNEFKTSKNLGKLLKWKDTREPFWKEPEIEIEETEEEQVEEEEINESVDDEHLTEQSLVFPETSATNTDSTIPS